MWIEDHKATKGIIAQSVEHRAFNLGVVSSILTDSRIIEDEGEWSNDQRNKKSTQWDGEMVMSSGS